MPKAKIGTSKQRPALICPKVPGPQAYFENSNASELSKSAEKYIVGLKRPGMVTTRTGGTNGGAGSSFGHAKRRELNEINSTPGPASYKLPTTFAHLAPYENVCKLKTIVDV